MRVLIRALATLPALIPLGPALAEPQAPVAPARVAPLTDAATRQTCGACHMAFQPALLPAPAWHQLMAGLAEHFGERVAPDPGLATQVEAVLTAGGGSVPAAEGGELRITAQPWFRNLHRRVEPVQWTWPEIGSKANCLACHAGAERGDYTHATGGARQRDRAAR